MGGANLLHVSSWTRLRLIYLIFCSPAQAAAIKQSFENNMTGPDVSVAGGEGCS